MNERPNGFDAHYPLLKLVARQYVRSAADVDDVVQNGLVRFWRYGQGHAADIKAYLATCVRNAALDFLKARQTRQEKEQAVGKAASDAQEMFECPAELAERRLLLEQAMDSLPVEQREVLVLRIWGELTFPEIGTATGVSPNTATSRYRYALTALKQKLGESFF